MTIPRELIVRKKFGLPVPLVDWFRDKNGLGRYLDLLTDKRSCLRSFCDSDEIQRIIALFLKGHNEFSDVLWVLVNLELWQRIFVENDKAYS